MAGGKGIEVTGSRNVDTDPQRDILKADNAYTPDDVWRTYPPAEQALVKKAIDNGDLDPDHRRLYWENWQQFKFNLSTEFAQAIQSGGPVNLTQLIERAILPIRHQFDEQVPTDHAAWKQQVTAQLQAGQNNLDTHLWQAERYAQELLGEVAPHLPPLMRVHDVFKYLLPFKIDGVPAQGQHEVDHEMLLRVLFAELLDLMAKADPQIQYQWGTQQLSRAAATKLMPELGELGAKHENLYQEAEWSKEARDGNQNLFLLFVLDVFTDGFLVQGDQLEVNPDGLRRFQDLVFRHLFTGAKEKDPAKVYNPQWPLYAIEAILSGAEEVAKLRNVQFAPEQSAAIITAVLVAVEQRLLELKNNEGNPQQLTHIELNALQDGLFAMMPMPSDATEESKETYRRRVQIEAQIAAYQMVVERVTKNNVAHWFEDIAQQIDPSREWDGSDEPPILDENAQEYWRVIRNQTAVLPIIRFLSQQSEADVQTILTNLATENVDTSVKMELARAVHATWLLQRMAFSPPDGVYFPQTDPKQGMLYSLDWVHVQATAQALLKIVTDQPHTEPLTPAQLLTLATQPRHMHDIAFRSEMAYMKSLEEQAYRPKSGWIVKRLEKIANKVNGQWQLQDMPTSVDSSESPFSQDKPGWAERKSLLLNLPSVLVLMEELPALAREIQMNPMHILAKIKSGELSPLYLDRLVRMQKMMHLWAKQVMGEASDAASLFDPNHDDYRRDEDNLVKAAAVLYEELTQLSEITAAEKRVREVQKKYPDLDIHHVSAGITQEQFVADFADKLPIDPDLVLFVSGGAANMEQSNLNSFIGQFVEMLVKHLQQNKKIVVVTGGTNSGIMQVMGNIVATVKEKSKLTDGQIAGLNLIGVPPSSLVGPEDDSKGSYYAIIPSLHQLLLVHDVSDAGGREKRGNFGLETPIIAHILHMYAQKPTTRMINVTANGGVGTVVETGKSLEVQGMEVLVLENSGRWAGLIAAVKEAGQDILDNPNLTDEQIIPKLEQAIPASSAQHNKTTQEISNILRILDPDQPQNWRAAIRVLLDHLNEGRIQIADPIQIVQVVDNKMQAQPESEPVR